MQLPGVAPGLSLPIPGGGGVAFLVKLLLLLLLNTARLLLLLSFGGFLERELAIFISIGELNK